MTSRLSEKDLNELKEMTGLTTEAEVINHSPAAFASVRPAQRKEYHGTGILARREDLEKAYVGKYVKVDGFFGMIDDVHGARLGFVHCEKDTWTASLVDTNEVTVLYDEASVRKARISTLSYFENEKQSLEHRIKCAFKFDDQMKLNHMLWYVDKWLTRLNG